MPEAVHVPTSATEEGALCLLLTLEPRKAGARAARPLRLIWPLALLLEMAACPRYLAHALSGLALSQRKHAPHWLVLCLAFMASGQAAKAKLALESMEGEPKTGAPPLAGALAAGPLPLLLRVKACLQIGDAALTDAVRCAREAVQQAGEGSALEGKAQQALGVALLSAALRPGVLPSGERGPSLEAALEALQKSAQFDPGDPLTLYHLGLVQAEARQLDDAEKSARGALAASAGTLGPAWALLALVVSAQQRVSVALSVAREALRQVDPRHHPLLHRIQARLLVAMGEPDEALEHLAMFLADIQKAAGPGTSPVGAAAGARRAGAQAEVWLELARCFLAKGRTGDAAECVERALLLAPTSASAHHVKGRVLHEEGNVEGAEAAYWTALSMDCRHAKSLLMLGRLHRKQHGPYDPALAEGFLRQGLHSDAQRNVGWYNVGLLQASEQRWEEAEQSLRTAVGLALTAPVMSFHKLPRPF